MDKIIRIGTRPSLLALRQVEEIRRLLPGVALEVVTIETSGDRDKLTPLAETEGSDFFTHEIEQALLDFCIDAAVHSAKDLEEIIPDGLVIAAITGSISPYECLVSRNNLKLDQLAFESRIGTSSKKRKEALVKYRSDFLIKGLRGTIDERLQQLDRGDFDAIIVAHAALIRLGYTGRISQIIPAEIIQPHPLQGRLAVQVREDRVDLLEIFRRIDGKQAG